MRTLQENPTTYTVCKCVSECETGFGAALVLLLRVPSPRQPRFPGSRETAAQRGRREKKNSALKKYSFSFFNEVAAECARL